MKQVKDLYLDILENGVKRTTRTGEVISVWDRKLQWDMSEGFPATTSKTLSWNLVVGELLWFLSFSDDLSDLRRLTFGKDEGQWTIWTDDAARWSATDPDYVGDLYPTQWRNYNRSGVDQIENLIHTLKNSPHERNHLVMAWNPEAISFDMMALKPCHFGFQCYVTSDDKLNLKWFQRSCDAFLGLPFNIASYGLLLHMLCEWTGYTPGILSCDLGDVHIYEDHLGQVKRYIGNREYDLPVLNLPEKAKTFKSLIELTALDFQDSLIGYKSVEPIRAKLRVGS